MSTPKTAEQRERHAAYMRAWNRANPEKRDAYNRRWREKNVEIDRANKRAWFQSNRDRAYARKRQWIERHRRPFVYLCYDGTNTPIYVGRANGPSRFTDHRAAAWWPEVAKIRIRHTKDYADSLVLEALFIRRYQPKHNTVGVTR